MDQTFGPTGMGCRCQTELNLALADAPKNQVCGHPRRGFLGELPSYMARLNVWSQGKSQDRYLSLECIYQDWVSSVAGACEVDSMLRCTRGT